MSPACERFLAALQAQSATNRILADHIVDNDEVLLHLLVADLLRHAERLFAEGREEPLALLLQVLEEALTSADESLENAVAVSFVEDARLWDPSTRPFVRTWPIGLQEEAQRLVDYWDLRRKP